ncbi:MAG: erythromycin esterase family protein, partial [bacterium]
MATSTFPVEEARGKHLRYTGHIKTDSITTGYAGLWWRVDGKSGTVGFDNMNDRGPSGTTPWTKYEIELDLDTTAHNINFGVLLPGDGKAWFDGLQIELDGKIYEQIPPEPFIPSKKQISWLRDRSIVFDTAEPKEAHKDLLPLKSLIGDARIVALGEGTHGTSEFFKMKHRIIKFLAEEMGFTVFAIEANMPEARRVNEYVLTGKGDPKEALAGMYFWTWNTQEVLDMIEWMRQFNSSGKGHIEFWGFDMQYPHVATDNVQSFIEKAEPGYLDSLSQSYDKVRESYKALRGMRSRSQGILYEPWHQAAIRVLHHLQGKRGNYLETFGSLTVEQTLQDARIVVQAAEAHMSGKPSRDESMAFNVD